MVDPALSEGVIAFVGWDTDASIPGRHPERVADLVLRERVLRIIRKASEEEPGSQGLWAWGEEVRTKVSSEFPEISTEAVEAIVALLTYEWR